MIRSRKQTVMFLCYMTRMINIIVAYDEEYNSDNVYVDHGMSEVEAV